MSLSDSDVQMHIRYYLARARAGSVKSKVERAWKEVNGFRLENCGYGEEIVFVEHYLYMRHIVGTYLGILALPVIYTFIPAYDGYKAIAQYYDLPFWQEGECPPSSPSARVRRWAWTGAVNGVDDGNGRTKLGKMAESVPARPLSF